MLGKTKINERSINKEALADMLNKVASGLKSGEDMNEAMRKAVNDDHMRIVERAAGPCLETIMTESMPVPDVIMANAVAVVSSIVTSVLVSLLKPETSEKDFIECSNDMLKDVARLIQEDTKSVVETIKSKRKN